MTINWRKLPTGNWVGRHKKYYFFIYKRPHGKWCAEIRDLQEKWFYSEGYFGTYLKTVAMAKKWCKDKLKNIKNG